MSDRPPPDEPAPAKRARTEALAPLSHGLASSKGRKQEQQDVPLAVADLLDDGSPLVSLYAVLDGHGGADVAKHVAAALPAALKEALTGATASADIKAGVKRAFARVDAEVLERCAADGWCDGACCVALLIDRRCSPNRAYCANLGDSRAFACVAAGAVAGAPPRPPTAFPLTKDHTALEPKERKRIEGSGGYVEGGRVCGSLEVSRSFGDARLKKLGLSCAPDVASFALGSEHRFALLGCDGFWRAWSGQQAVDALVSRLPRMDERRREIGATLDDPHAASALTREAAAALARERESEDEDGVVRELVHEAVHARHAIDNVTCLMVRLAG